MNLIEKFENEKKSLNYHLESLKNKIEKDPTDELAKEQIKKIESYIKAIDEQLKELSE